MKCKIQKAFWLKALKPSVPAAVKWSEVKPRAHLWPQFQPEPGSGSLKMVEGQKSRVKDGETSALATLTRATYQPALDRRKERKTLEVECGERACRAGKSRGCAQISAFHKSSPFARVLNPSTPQLPFGSVLDLAGREGSS